MPSTSDSDLPVDADEAEVVIIGSGPAGLAAAACLRRKGVSPVVLERAEHVGSAWRAHYDRLRLHTAKGHSGLPFTPFTPETPRYPSRDQVVDYLECYAGEHGIEPRFGKEVVSAQPTTRGWTTETKDGERIHSRHLVVATGYTGVPHIPTWPGQDDFRGELLHSSRFKSAEQWRGKRCLVVGFGSSGGEIVVDFHERGASSTIAVHNPVNVVPKEILGVPLLTWGILLSPVSPRLADLLAWPMVRLLVGDITKVGLKKLPYGPMVQIREKDQVPLIDAGTMRLLRQGKVPARPGLERFTERGVVFVDGAKEDFDVVVLATGFRPHVHRFLEIDGVLDEEGTPLSSGRQAAPGLYFIGFNIVATGALREMGIESLRIAKEIAHGKRGGQLGRVRGRLREQRALGQHSGKTCLSSAYAVASATSHR